MMYDKHGNRPTSGAKSIDYDDTALIAKCGNIKIHHWAREVADPDTWHEPETDWHRAWKSIFKPENTEQTIIVDGIKHRMDAQAFLNGTRYAVEFQHSHISPDEIRQREDGYKNMIWVFDCIGKDIDVAYIGNGINRLHWKRPRQSIFWCNNPVLLDVGNTRLYQIISMPEYANDYWYGCGCVLKDIKEVFLHGVFNKYTKGLESLIKEGAA